MDKKKDTQEYQESQETSHVVGTPGDITSEDWTHQRKGNWCPRCSHGLANEKCQWCGWPEKARKQLFLPEKPIAPGLKKNTTSILEHRARLNMEGRLPLTKAEEILIYGEEGIQQHALDADDLVADYIDQDELFADLVLENIVNKLSEKGYVFREREFYEPVEVGPNILNACKLTPMEKN